MNKNTRPKQAGITLVGLIFVLAILGVVGVLALKIVPTAIEFMSIKKAMAAAKAAGTTPLEIRSSFDKQANTGYIDTISGKDLEFTKDGDQIDVSVAYQKKDTADRARFVADRLCGDHSLRFTKESGFLSGRGTA